MSKLSADLLLRRESYLNALQDRELDLRGLSIPAIENLGVTKNQLDSIDLSDNAITALSNVPHLPRLKQILLNGNPIAAITPNLARAVPNLNALFLASTQISNIRDLVPLSSCKHLEFLSLRDSPVTRVPNYRSWLIFNCPSLRAIDFEKVKQKERVHAKSLFVSEDGKPTPLANSITAAASANGNSAKAASKSFEPGSAATENKGRLLTAQDKARIKQAIEAATTLEEVKRLQRSLEEGFIPSEKELQALRGQ